MVAMGARELRQRSVGGRFGTGCLVVAVTLLAVALHSGNAQQTVMPDVPVAPPPRTADCQAILMKKTVVVFPGPEPPYLADLGTLMPTHTIDISDAAVGLLALSVPAMAECVKGIEDIENTLMIWDDGNLTQYQDVLPRGLTKTKGQLIIKGKQGMNLPPSLNNLDFLNKLEAVKGLSVYNMDILTNLTGLSNLVNITGDLIISENDRLLNLGGLDKLDIVEGDFIMNSNENLKTLDGLENLDSIGGSLLLKGNGHLLSTDPLIALRRVGQTVDMVNNGNLQMTLPPGVAVGPGAVVVKRAVEGAGGFLGRVLVIHGGDVPPPVSDIHDALDTFSPPMQQFDVTVQRVRFSPASEVVTTGPNGALLGHVVVWDDGQLGPSGLITALGGISSISGSLVILGGHVITTQSGAGALLSLAGLQGLQTVDQLGVVGTTQLSNFTGLSGLTAIHGTMAVLFNMGLNSFSGLGPAPGAAGLPAAGIAPNSALAILRASTRGLLQDASPTFTKIGSELWIQGNPLLHDLDGLENLKEVGWKLTIRECPMLASLDGLRSLRRVGNTIVFVRLNSLNSTAGLASLQEVGMSVAMLWNEKLKDVEGLARISVLAGDLQLSGNPLVSLAPLANLRALGLNLIVAYTALSDLKGLEGLTTVGGLVSLEDNPFTSLAGLGALTRVGADLSVRGNAQLSSLEPLASALHTVGGGIYIEDNPALASLGGLPAGLQGAGGLVVVRRNGRVPDAQTATLAVKNSQAVPNTVALLSQVLAEATNASTSAYPQMSPTTMLSSSSLTNVSVSAASYSP